MKRVYVIVEGQTEESFVKGPLAEAMWPLQVLLLPIVLGVPGKRGGNVSYARVQSDLIRQLKQDRTGYCSTMLDYYGLGKGFPGESILPQSPSLERVQAIERGIQDDICTRIPDYRPDVRLIPHLALHEFEGLLFSDPAALAGALREPQLRKHLQEVRNKFSTPEDINDGPETAPSKRILAVCPGYRKVIQGTLAGRAIGVEAMRRECPHFRAWLARLSALPDL